MAETIWVRFSAGGAAVAEVAALPVVCDFASAGLLVSAFILPPLVSAAPLLSDALLELESMPLLLSRPSAFMSLPPLVVSVSELMLFDFSPAGDFVSCALLLAGIFSFDSDAFVPDESGRLVSVDSAPF